MLQMHSGLFHGFVLLVAGNHFFSYPILFAGAVFLGNLFSFAVLWVAFHHSLGTHPLAPVALTLFAAHLTGDILWYSCGRALRGTKLGEWIRGHLPHHAALEKHLQANSSRWIFISEFVAYSAFPIFFLVGWTQVKFRSFLPVAAAALACSFSILFTATYLLVSSLSMLRALSIFRHLETIFGIGLLAFLLLNYLLSRIVRKKFAKEDH
jgi:membrane protein DedA with SNARE-associated domain